MKQIGVAIIGTGWCGGIRAETCAAHPLTKSLHLAEIRPERLAEMAKATRAKSAVADYRELLSDPEIDAVYISATPETTHYPMARDCLSAGKHVFLEKPIAMELAEADELIALRARSGLKFTIGYSQRFNPKFAYVRQSIRNGTIGKPVSALVSRHITRGLGKKISGRVKLSPAAMECDARPRLRAVVPGAGEAGARLFAGQLRRDAGGERPADRRTRSGSRSPWTAASRSSSAAAGACRSAIRTSRPPGSRWSAPRARCSSTTATATWCSTP